MSKLLNLVRVSFVGLLCLASVSAQQVLRWGADPSGGAPYVYNDPNHPDRYIGYEKEMVDAMAAAMGRKPEFVPSDWETLVSALQRGSFDVIVNGLEPTTDRAKQIDFSNAYYVFELQLTIRSDESRIRTLADCHNRVVGTLGNTAASRLMQKDGIPWRGERRAHGDGSPTGPPVGGAIHDICAVGETPATLIHARYKHGAVRPAGVGGRRRVHNAVTVVAVLVVVDVPRGLRHRVERAVPVAKAVVVRVTRAQIRSVTVFVDPVAQPLGRSGVRVRVVIVAILPFDESVTVFVVPNVCSIGDT